MNLTQHVERLRQQLSLATEAGDDETRVVADRLIASLEPVARLVLLEALSAAADEVTRELAPGSVELRLRSGEPEFVVAMADSEPPADSAGAAPPPAAAEDDDAAIARINLRLPEALKERVDEAASRERLSTNAWLVRLIAAAVNAPGGSSRPRSGRPGQSYTGWVG